VRCIVGKVVGTLDWDGCCNVRDLGGLPTRDGRRIGWGTLVRGDHPSKLSAAGWESLVDHGIRTSIGLYSYDKERNLVDAAPRPAPLTTVPVEIEDVTDADFRCRAGSLADPLRQARRGLRQCDAGRCPRPLCAWLRPHRSRDLVSAVAGRRAGRGHSCRLRDERREHARGEYRRRRSRIRVPPSKPREAHRTKGGRVHVSPRASAGRGPRPTPSTTVRLQSMFMAWPPGRTDWS